MERKVFKRNQLIMMIQIIVAVLLGLEVSIPPNPYQMPLIISMVILICLKHDIPNKLLNRLFK
jgi:hypothetical protein